MISPILLVAVVIGSLIIIHEFGHLIIAKLCRIQVETFSVGFGPVILRKKLGSTEYRLSLIPLGGYIKMAGDELDATTGFNAASFGKKTAVILAGPASNFLLGIILTVILFAGFGFTTIAPKIIPQPQAIQAGFEFGDEIISINQDTIRDWQDIENQFENLINQTAIFQVKRDNKVVEINYPITSDTLPFSAYVVPIIDRVKKSSPAHKIGLQKGDQIIQIDTFPVKEWSEFVELIRDVTIPTRYLRWQRGDQILDDSITITITKDELTQKKIGAVGVWVRLPEKPMPAINAITTSISRSFYVAVQTFVIIYKVITGEIPKSAIGGPVMVGKLTYEGAQWGIKYLLGLWAILSINLCVINLFPVPILDGGRVLLYAIESAIGKKFTKKQWEIAFYIGYALIALLLIFALSNDITRLIRR
ncbi:MAG: RIP metalloprotease RseP [Candidatus Latescibacteria bacterium]|nr:RIP metalloprotease RseP [Candidatus Latescibacterota bacterium]